jgi:tRNA threonylcarbamoyladenosine biosynthesis protein TsaB
MRVLALDTSTPTCAVAALDGARVLAEDDRASEQRHGTLLLPRIRDVLAAAGLPPSALTLIAVGIGPGSFTGLRTGLATAKGLALALSIPLRAVCSLRALAAGLPELLDGATSLRVATIDAGKGELFLAAFAGDRVTPEPALLAPQRALPAQAVEALRTLAASPLGRGRTLHVCGAGVRRHPELLAALGPAAVLAEAAFDAPSGRNVGRLGLAAFAAEGPSELSALVPSYLRDSDAKLPARPLTVE